MITSKTPKLDLHGEIVAMVEVLVNEFINDNYTLIFLDEDKWNLEKEKYIKNLKNKHKYEYMEENIENTSTNEDINAIIGDVFDIEKVEIE